MKKVLNLPLNPLVDSFKAPRFLYIDNRNRYFPIDLGFVNKETLDIFEELNLKIGGVVLFKKHPNGISPIHTDVLKVDDTWVKWHAAINYNLTAAVSKMMWFNTSLPEIYPSFLGQTVQPKEYNLSGIHYGENNNANTESKDFSLIEEFQLIQPTLVRTSIPHTTINMDDKVRLCASIRFTDNYTFEELLEKFEGYF